ncbi:hypothetical protein [Marinisporobacter balticus]|uniref:Uncharacterized protein n=1 Tax=Marinisporobacter balticus TaxID=2018667 RepID=A0A4V2S9X6_9FIRM|nr:hypothetical protein [Marinisporobacter balticus]TCO69540.1 hypothetical protein EV214_13164 [Marinisporobacter balticus]
MNKWHIYSALKNGSDIVLGDLEKMSAEEVKEGVIEYFLMSNRSGSECA